MKEGNYEQSNRNREPKRWGWKKTTTAMNLGVGLALEGKKVLLIDADGQGSLSICAGIETPKELNYTLATVLGKEIMNEPVDPAEGIHHFEGVDLMPCNVELSGMMSPWLKWRIKMTDHSSS